MGTVLMQRNDNGKYRVLAYNSRLLNKAEQNYDVTNLESLSVIWALRHFRELILGYRINVLKDQYAVTEILKDNSLTGKFAIDYSNQSFRILILPSSFQAELFLSQMR